MGRHKHHKKRASLKKMITIFVFIIGVLLLAFVAGGLFQTYQVEHQASNKVFTGGSVPQPLPDGYYKGKQNTGIGEAWQGKRFESAKQTGINKFSDGERYEFKTYPAKGLRDKDLEVLRIDYNQAGNPWWLKFIVDEITETKSGEYQGKVHLKLIPGLPFTLTTFELKK